nr:hypothetical protein [Tanacetum cinerariifolium]
LIDRPDNVVCRIHHNGVFIFDPPRLKKMVEGYVFACFGKDMYMLAYSQYMKSIDGINFWLDYTNLSRILDHKPKKMPGKKKAGRPKKIPYIENLDKDNDVPRFVNNDIDEYEMGSLNSKVMFNDGRVIHLGKFNLNQKRRGSSCSTGHLKMRREKTKAGRLVLAHRLGRMRDWLGMDATRSDIIEDSKPLHALFLP